MFTGLVEKTGVVREIKVTKKGRRLTIGLAGTYKLQIGESVSVNGCCLTVTRLLRPTARLGAFQVDLLQETWDRTGFSFLKKGDPVNLERALRAQDRLGGHFVTGHIDGPGKIRSWKKVGNDWLLEVEPPRALARYLVEKGSVCLDGISLTVARVEPRFFQVWIIPHTYQMTNAVSWREGRSLNLEVDILGKYVERLMGGPLSWRR